MFRREFALKTAKPMKKPAAEPAQRPKRDSVNVEGKTYAALHEELLTAVSDSTEEAYKIAKANGCSDAALSLFK